ncbi:MAG: TonB-dependent receptor [Brevundimonas sp.]|nr:MAG: TonB-dependent receptor [Brevundimonas sp.]
MLLVTTALSGLMAGVIQTAPAPQAAPPQTPPPVAQAPAAEPEDDQALPTTEGDPEATDLGTVIATGARARGSVDSDIPPDVVLTAEDIQAYGASSIEELLTYLEPLTRSSRGRADAQPVTLVNGRRVTGFREIAGIPPEAIERVDILPEEVALRYGYKADQRVVNFVLKNNFRSISGQVTGTVPTEGGRTTIQAGGNALNIAGPARYSMDLDYRRSTPLYESERDIVRDSGDSPFDLIGNVRGLLVTDPATQETYVDQIDPAFSALVGQAATVAPIPGSGPSTLAGFASAYGPARTGDLSAYRTLLSASEQSTIRGTIKRDLNSTTQATVSASLVDQSSESFSGLPGITLTVPNGNPFSPFSDDVLAFRYLEAPAALSRQTDTLTGNLGVVLDGFLGEDWRWTFTGAYDRVETDTSTGRGYAALQTAYQARLNANDPTANPFGALNPADFAALPFDAANSVSESLSAEVNLTGDVFELPAGTVHSTFTFGADTRSLDSTSVRSGATIDRSQSRDRLNGQGSFDIPLLSRPDEADGPNRFGDLDLNLNVGYEDLSDFGGLKTLGAGLNWAPITPLSFLVSYTNEEGAPSISQLNDPVISTPAVPVFDFLNNETVLVTRIDGGNPNLVADNRQVFKAGVTLRPLKETDLSLSSTWTRSVTDDPINGFPTITPDLEAALPERFVRGADGELLSFDARALNFDRAERQDIRTGFNFSRAFGTPTPPRQGAAGLPGAAGGPRPAVGGPMIIMQGGPPPGGGGGGGGPRAGGGDGQVRMNFGGGGGGRGGRGGGMQPGQGRFNVSIYHTYRIQDEIIIRDGLPTLDLLNGAATSSNGGSPKNEIQLQAGVFKSGFGGFLNANWRESTTINGGSGPDLIFADRTTVNLNVFMDLSQRTSWVQRFPFLKGSRINLGVQNLFDSEVEVRSTAGDTPLNYQPDFLDPTGRSVSLTFRKILF